MSLSGLLDDVDVFQEETATGCTTLYAVLYLPAIHFRVLCPILQQKPPIHQEGLSLVYRSHVQHSGQRQLLTISATLLKQACAKAC